MNAESRDLPMAIADCALDPANRDDQVDRYRRLGATARTIDRATDRLLITFESTVDLELLSDTIATERSCCPFFALDYDASRRRLSISVADPSHFDALDVLLSTIRPDAGPTAGR